MATAMEQGRSLGTGRRKEAVARVRLIEGGTGKFELNGRPLEEYFPSRAHRMVVTAPLRVIGREKDFDVDARLNGGGVAGQAGALRQGLARALIEHDPGLRAELKKKLAPENYPYVHGMADKPQIQDVKLNVRGNPHSLGDTVPRRFLTVLTSPTTKPVTSRSSSSTCPPPTACSPRSVAARTSSWKESKR